MKLGVTGTREGMTREQQKNCAFVISQFKWTRFAHGDCIGVDDQAVEMAWAVGIPMVVCYPPIDEKLRAFNMCFHEMRTAKTHFARNRDIVDDSDVVLVVPKTNGPITKKTMGGTAYTCNYARKVGKRVVILWPDGRIEGSFLP